MSDDATPSPVHVDSPAALSAKALADRNALAAVAVERTRMPMVVTDPRQPDNPIVLANRAFLDLTGYTADEVIGRNCRFLQGEGTSPEAVMAIRDALAGGREFEVEILNYRKDGSAFWNQLSLSPVYNDAGKMSYVFGSQIDVTELGKIQNLEASENRLLNEVNHRARNVLAVVGGILRLTRADDATQYANAIQERIQVLAQAHSLLAERGWQEVDLERIIREQIDSASNGRISLAGPPVMVSALVVQPISLVLHELIDNAKTHGALSVPAGTVNVQWRARADYGAFDLCWREVGGPAFSPQPRAGFGTAMITAMIERQLRGEVERAWTDGAFTVSIRVPGASKPLITPV